MKIILKIFFSVEGKAIYDSDNNIVTLTKDEKVQAGFVKLKQKISCSSDFELSGAINVGSKNSSQGGQMD